MLEFLRNSDKLAFTEMYNRYHQDLYRYSMTLVKVSDIAEDLVQEVFIKIWDARYKLEVKQSFRSYLFRICHNRAIDINKGIASKRHLTNLLVYHYEGLIEPEPFSQEESYRCDKLIEEALNSLTPQRRKVYDLCKREKKSYDDVAQELGISLNTVKAHITQTLSLLRNYISKHTILLTILILLKKTL